jgi:hypothetical protein
LEKSTSYEAPHYVVSKLLLLLLSKWILERYDGMVWIVLIWLRIGTSGGFL